MNPVILIIYLLFIAIVFTLSVATGAMLYAARRLTPDPASAHLPDTLILLGCKTRTPSIEGRIRTAASWLKAHPKSICICSGGQGEDEETSEARYMKEGLSALGIDWKRLPMEGRSKNTRENLAFSHRLIASLARSESVILVTSAFHCYRAVYLGRKEGLSCLALPAPNPKRSFLLFYLREIIAIWACWLS